MMGYYGAFLLKVHQRN